MSLNLLLCPLGPSPHCTPTPLSHSPCPRHLPSAQDGQEFQILDFPEKNKGIQALAKAAFPSSGETSPEQEKPEQIQGSSIPMDNQGAEHLFPPGASGFYTWKSFPGFLDGWNSISLRVSLVATNEIIPFIPEGRARSSPSPLFLLGFLCLLVVQLVQGLPGNKRHS